MTTVRREVVKFRGFTITKDLTDDQILCATCDGSGLVVRDYIYGLSGEKRIDGKLFPYNRPYVGPCPDCYFGVRRVCGHCHRPIKERHRTTCECPAAEAEKNAAYAEKERAKVDKATRLTIDQAVATGVEMVYSEGIDRYYSLDELSDALDELEPDETLGTLWACKATDMALNAYDIIESAAERLDLHEDAVDNIGKAAQAELQALLDAWAAKHGQKARTYHPDYSRVVVCEPVEAPTA